MKAKYLFLIGCILFVLPNTNLFAQNNKVEKIINGETYVIDRNTSIKNKKNKRSRGNACEYVYLEDFSAVDNALKSFFSKDRLNKLAQMESVMRLTVYCDASGKIEEVSFYMRKDIDAFPLAEIQLLEKHLIGLSIKIKGVCPDVNEYTITKTYRFKDHFLDK